jgi:hypothetical protein
MARVIVRSIPWNRGADKGCNFISGDQVKAAQDDRRSSSGQPPYEGQSLLSRIVGSLNPFGPSYFSVIGMAFSHPGRRGVSDAFS